MKHSVIDLCLLTASAMPVIAAGSDMEGIWRAYVQSGFSSSKVDLIIAEDMFRMEFSGMLKENLAGCEFLGRFTAGGTEARLNGNNRQGACEDAPAIAIARVDMNTLKLDFSGAVTEPFAVDVHGVIKRTNANDLPAVPANLDILGVTLGSGRDVVKETLAGQQMTERVALDTIDYVRADESDIIAVIYDDPSSNDARAPALALYRQLLVPEGERLTIKQMDAALSGKYGAPSVSRGDSREWYFDAVGKLVSPDRVRASRSGCDGASPARKHRVMVRDVRVDMEFVSGCGSQLYASYETDLEGKVSGVAMKLIDSALFLNAVWESYRQGHADLLRQDFEALDAQRDAPAPKL